MMLGSWEGYQFTMGLAASNDSLLQGSLKRSNLSADTLQTKPSFHQLQKCIFSFLQ